MLNRHITPYFSTLGLPIKDIKPIHLEHYCTEKISEGLSPTTVIKHIGLIRPALKDAVKNAYIRTNPAENMKKPKKAKAEMHYYNAEQLQKLLSAAIGTPIEVPVVLGIMLGLRRSEIVGLRWSAIDFEKMILSIKQKAITGMVDGKTQTVISATLKTEASESDFKLNSDLCKYLKALKEKQRTIPRETKEYMDYVCVNAVGDLLKPDYITSKFKKLLKANGLPPIRFHDLRHSCISLLANDSRFSMKQIQDYARHANFLTTANIYSHTNIDIKQYELDCITENFKDFFSKES
jgi:integrase